MRLSCFFFQAEDGIRDYKVTGVQTCALPILNAHCRPLAAADADETNAGELRDFLSESGVGKILDLRQRQRLGGDRKSTRLNSSHLVISYAVFCLKKKKKKKKSKK